jgi:hypothetical protein
MKNIYILAGVHEHPDECEPDIITDVFTSRREAAKQALEIFRETFPVHADEFTEAGCMESNFFEDGGEVLKLEINAFSI